MPPLAAPTTGTDVPLPRPVGDHPATVHPATGSAVVTSTARVLIPAAGSGRTPLAEALAAEGIAVLVSPVDGLVGQVGRGGVDLVLLTGARAFEDLADLRAASSVPVIVVTLDGRASWDRYLTAGADDCVVRGVSRRELAARVRASLRRAPRSAPGELVRVGAFAVDLARHVFTVGGVPMHLPPKEFGLLELLLRRDGRVVGRREALELVWGAAAGSDPTTVDVHVKRLRCKFEVDPGHPEHLLTVRGLGYRFVP